MSEFNLSERIVIPRKLKGIQDEEVIHKDNVKEFIERLKESLHFNCVEKDDFIGFTEEAYERDIESVIDKLAGDKLK